MKTNKVIRDEIIEQENNLRENINVLEEKLIPQTEFLVDSLINLLPSEVISQSSEVGLSEFRDNIFEKLYKTVEDLRTESRVFYNKFLQ